MRFRRGVSNAAVVTRGDNEEDGSITDQLATASRLTDKGRDGAGGGGVSAIHFHHPSLALSPSLLLFNFLYMRYKLT